MKRYLLASVLGVGLVVGSVPLLTTNSVAAQTQQSPVVFNADGTMQLPTGFRKWVFLGAPLTPEGLNHGK